MDHRSAMWASGKAWMAADHPGEMVGSKGPEPVPSRVKNGATASARKAGETMAFTGTLPKPERVGEIVARRSGGGLKVRAAFHPAPRESRITVAPAPTWNVLDAGLAMVNSGANFQRETTGEVLSG